MSLHHLAIFSIFFSICHVVPFILPLLFRFLPTIIHSCRFVVNFFVFVTFYSYFINWRPVLCVPPSICNFSVPTFLSYILCCTVRFACICLLFPFLELFSCFLLKNSCSTPFFPIFSNLLANVLCVWFFVHSAGRSTETQQSGHRGNCEHLYPILTLSCIFLFVYFILASR